MRLSSFVVPAAMAALAACHRAPSGTVAPVTRPPRHAVVPAPAAITISAPDSFLVTDHTPVFVDADASAEVEAIGTYAADLVASRFGATAQRLAVGTALPDSSIGLQLDPSRAELGGEGYELTVTPARVRIVAYAPAGLFYGVQTMRQLLPPAVEHRAAMNRRLIMPAAHVLDVPRFAWRGAMLDVARHFLSANDVKRFVDLLALYKINRLHLHLADDQGWRIQIKSWPRLTEVGGAMEIGDGPGGYYTQEQYADIVAYARSRYITVVPEIDMPGHSNAALIAYPELTCDGVAPEPFLRIGGAHTTLCPGKDTVYTFVADVVGEISGMAPTPYFHIGGDEVQGLTQEQYQKFILRVEQIVDSIGPRMIGWSEIAPVPINPHAIVQHWTKDSTILHVQRGGQVIMSPGPRVYIDMKYDSTTVLGLRWAGLIDLHRAYDWDPATLLPGVGIGSILGVEAPLWAETLITRQDREYLAFPRITAVAELGWSPVDQLGWDGFRRRIGMHGKRLAALGVNFARVPGVPWTW